MYINLGNVKIKRIISDLRDAIVDSKRVALFEYERPLLSLVETWQRRDLKYENSPLDTTRDNVQNSLSV